MSLAWESDMEEKMAEIDRDWHEYFPSLAEGTWKFTAAEPKPCERITNFELFCLVAIVGGIALILGMEWWA